MFTECRKVLKQSLEDAGLKGKIHTSRKTLKTSNESRIGAVLFEDEQLENDGSKCIYQDINRKKRKKKYQRDITFTAVIGEYSVEEAETIYNRFLALLPTGVYVDGNYVSIEPKQTDWLDEEDSILKSKCAVQVQVVCSGGIYTDTGYKEVTEVEVSVIKGD